MSEMPLVSVIMIFLNGEQFMQEAIESVFAQTYEHWELVLIDDGSTDGSEALARQFAERHPEKVRYLTHPGRANHGMSASRNLGTRAARGEYVAFLDADDVYLPEKLARQVSWLIAQPSAGMVYGATQHWYSWTGRREDMSRDKMRRLGVPCDSLIQPPHLVSLFLRLEAQTPGTCGVLLRRGVLDAVGGFDETFKGMFEDQVFFYKVCLQMPVFVECGSGDRYRMHATSHSAAARKISGLRVKGYPHAAYGVFLTWLEGYLRDQSVGTGEVWQALKKEQWPYRHRVLYRLIWVAGRARAQATMIYRTVGLATRRHSRGA